MKRPQFLFICILPACLCLISGYKGHAQERIIKNWEAGIYFGFRYMDRDSFANTGNIDFMNYFVSYPEKGMPEYTYLGFRAGFQVGEDWQADIKVAMFDEFVPNNLNITARYMLHPKLGFSFGFYGYPIMINAWNEYHRINDTDFFGDANRGLRQRYIYEYGIIAGPAFDLSFRKLHFCGKMNAGISAYSRFSETVVNKQINSNLRIAYEYKTRTYPSLFFFPEIDLKLDLFRFNNTIAGLQMQGNYYIGKRSMDYERTTMTWTRENAVIETVLNPEHQIRKTEGDLGFYLRF